MTLLRRLAERRSIENPSYPLTSTALVDLFGGVRTSSGVDVSEKSAMANMAVWRAVNLISGTIAGLPLKTYRDRATPTSPRGERQEIELPLFQGEAYPDLTWFEYVQTTLVHLLLWGNAYSLKIRNEGGDKVARVLPLMPSDVSVSLGRRTGTNPSGKEFRLNSIEGEPLTPDEVMHIPGLSYDGLVGLSPIAQARQAVGVALAAEEVAAKLFDSGLMNGGFLQAERELTEAEADLAKRRWREKVAGLVRSYEVAIVSNGFKYHPATIPPREAQWIEARQFGVQEIARLFGIDPDHLMENSATGNTNVEQRSTNLVKFGLNTWIKRIESRMTVHLVPAGTFVELVVDGLLRGDSAARAAFYGAALNPQTGWMTRNEVRGLENLPPEEEDEEEEEEPEEEEAPPPVAPVPDPEEDEEEEEEAEDAA